MKVLEVLDPTQFETNLKKELGDDVFNSIFDGDLFKRVWSTPDMALSVFPDSPPEVIKYFEQKAREELRPDTPKIVHVVAISKAKNGYWRSYEISKGSLEGQISIRKDNCYGYILTKDGLVSTDDLPVSNEFLKLFGPVIERRTERLYQAVFKTMLNLRSHLSRIAHSYFPEPNIL